jgi:dUTP pyrophosphatase
MELNIKKTADVPLPAYSREGDCALDLRSSGRYTIHLDGTPLDIEQEEYALKPGERIHIKTGICLAIPKNYWGSIRDRSGLALKNGLHVLGGVIDETYRGEIGIVLINLSTKPYTIQKHERIAQLVISPYTTCTIKEVPELPETNRGTQWLGSSGRQ